MQHVENAILRKDFTLGAIGFFFMLSPIRAVKHKNFSTKTNNRIFKT